jgi:hypothetical protein
MKKTFEKGLTGLLFCMAIFIGCDNLNGTDTPTGKTALKNAIATANAAKNGIETSVDGTDIANTVYWVTADQLNTFTTAITAAQTIYDNENADEAMVDNAKTVLENAIAAFNGYKKPGTRTESALDIYVAGSYFNGVINIPCYWKNGIKTDLPLITGLARGSAEKIVIDGDDIYILGIVDDADGNRGCYWKNGAISLVPNRGYANNMVVSNEDVYIVGSYVPTADGGSIACYWKNGTKIDFSTASDWQECYATAIAVSGNIVYAVGMYSSTGDNDPYWGVCHWRNSSRSYLSGENYFVSSGNIIVIGSDVYTNGSHNDRAGYWKNSSFYFLSSENSGTNSIIVSNNTVYVCGWYNAGSNMKACYWIGSTKNNLDGGSSAKDSFANAITDSGGDVYVAGAVDVFYDFQNGTATSTACYWKNGQRIDLSNNAIANDIVIVLKNN